MVAADTTSSRVGGGCAKVHVKGEQSASPSSGSLAAPSSPNPRVAVRRTESNAETGEKACSPRRRRVQSMNEGSAAANAFFAPTIVPELKAALAKQESLEDTLDTTTESQEERVCKMKDTPAVHHHRVLREDTIVDKIQRPSPTETTHTRDTHVVESKCQCIIL